MSTLPSTDRKTDRTELAEMPYSAAAPGILMREKAALLRDTMIVLLLQSVFRATLLLRRWNY
jgi:hypothetical protein